MLLFTGVYGRMSADCPQHDDDRLVKIPAAAAAAACGISDARIR